MVQTLGSEHAASTVTVHTPSRAQQEPVGWTQGLGSQSANIVQTLGGAHSVCAVTAQTPSNEQQEPVGCVQGLGEQFVSAPCQMPGDRQSASVVTEHAPVGSQHAPTGIATPIPEQTIVPKVALSVEMVHVLLPADEG
jgi:hypothetical protein